jgi:hypothetical protein
MMRSFIGFSFCEFDALGVSGVGTDRDVGAGASFPLGQHGDVVVADVPLDRVVALPVPLAGRVVELAAVAARDVGKAFVLDVSDHAGVVDQQIGLHVLAVAADLIRVTEHGFFPVRRVEQPAVVLEICDGRALERAQRIAVEHLFGKPELAADRAVGLAVLEHARAGEPSRDANAAHLRARELSDAAEEVEALLLVLGVGAGGALAGLGQ